MVCKYGDKGEPRWVDITDYLQEVGRSHNGWAYIRMNPNLPVRTRAYLQVSVEFWPKGREWRDGFTVQASGLWPHTDFRSMTAMIFKLIFDLDFKLTQRQIEEEKQAHL